MRSTSAQRQVAVVPEQQLGQRLPADDELAVDLGDLAHHVRAGRRPQLGGSAALSRTSPEIGLRSAGFSASRPPMPWPMTTGARPEPLERRDDVLDVGVEDRVVESAVSDQ